MGKLLTVIFFLSATPFCEAQSQITRYGLAYSFDFDAKNLFGTASVDIPRDDTPHLLLYRLITVRTVRDNTGDTSNFPVSPSIYSKYRAQSPLCANLLRTGTKIDQNQESYAPQLSDHRPEKPS